MNENTSWLRSVVFAAVFAAAAPAWAQQPTAAPPPNQRQPPAPAPAQPAPPPATQERIGTPAPAPAPAAPAAVAAPGVPLMVNEYQLQPGDKLRIDVYKDEQLSQSVQIRPDGKVTMPLIGDVMASGLTPVALRDRLATSLKDYVNNPVVTVVVVEATSPIAYVIGEVNRPGTIELQRPITVLQALSLAGGLKDFANTKGIYIRRTTHDGRPEKIRFDYKSALRAESDELYLAAGDTVVVP